MYPAHANEEASVKKLSEPSLVSVVIPTYNSQSSIKQCLTSIKKQTYHKIEVLVVDRYSKDKTAQIAKKLGARVFFLDEERSKAKNYAAKVARGDFLLFIDSDMTLNSKIIEACVNLCLQKNVDAVIIPEKPIAQGLLSEWRKKEKASLYIHSEFVEIPRFFRKKAFLQAGGYDENLVCGEDFDFFQRFKRKGYKIGRIDCEIFHFEGELSISKILFKAYYYGGTIPELIKKDPAGTVRRYFSMRLTSLNDVGPAFGGLGSIIGFALMKLFEFAAYLLGFSSNLLHAFSEKRGIKTIKNVALKNKFVILNFLAILAVAVIIFRNFLFTDEWPGGGDVLGFISRAYLYGKDFRWLLMWRPYSFGFVEGINFMDFFLMLLYSIFRDPSWTIKTFMFLSYLTAGFSMYIFAYRHTRVHAASLVASLVYILNQWLFSQLTEAHVDIVFSYALAPLIFITLDKALNTGKLRDVLLLSISLSLFATSFHPECIVIYGVFLILFVVFFILYPTKMETAQIRFLRFLKVCLPSALIVFLFSAFFLIPFFMNVRSPYFHPSYEYPLEDAYLCSYSNMSDAFTLRAVERWGYINILDVHSEIGVLDFPLYSVLFVIFFLAYCVLLIRRNRYTIFFAVSMLISIFIAKGPNSPLGQVFIWAWLNIPHFAIFRAANRWVMMAIFSHAFFISLLTCYLIDYIKKKKHVQKDEFLFKVKLDTSSFSKNRRFAFSVDSLNVFLKKFRKVLYFLGVIFLILIFLSGFLSCFWFFSQGLQVYTPPKQYLAPYEWLSLQNDDYKVVSVGRSSHEWMVSPDEYSDFASSAMWTTIGWGHDIGFDSVFIHDKPVLQDGGWDFMPRQFVDHLRFRLAREHLTDNLFKILGPFAYKYIVIPPYATDKAREFFLNQEGYQTIYNDTAIILQNEYAMPRIFAVTNSMFAVGGLESFDALCKIEGFNLNETTLFFASVLSDSGSFESETLDKFQAVSFINSDVLDLAMLSFTGGKNFIFAGNYGVPSINYTAYWVKMASWRRVGASVLGGDTLTTSGKNRIDLPFELDTAGYHDLWLRIGFAPSRGKLNIYVDGEPIQEIRTEAPLWSKLAWVNITRLNLAKGTHSVTLENDGTGYNDIDAIVVVKSSELESRINEIMQTLQHFQGRILYLYEAESVFLDSCSKSWTWTVKPCNGYMVRSESLGLNVAPFASANTSSISWADDYSFGAQYANDDDMHTRWASEKSVVPQWLELTWEEPQQLLGVRLFFENAYAKDYSIQTWNGTGWVTQIEVTENNALDRTHVFAESVETNKLRIYVTAFSIHDRVSLWEFQAFSPGATSSSAKITIPREGNYILAARIAKGPSHGTLYFNVSGNLYPISCNSPTSQFEWCEIGPIFFEAGEHSISVGGVGLVELDEFLICSLKEGETYLTLNDLFSFRDPQVSISYEQVNSCLFRVHVDANEPFTLIFSDTYNSLWKAFVDGDEISSNLAYSVVNSFHINKTGQFTVTIYFTGQHYADLGLMVSIVSFVSVFTLAPVFVVVSRKRRFAKQSFRRRLTFWKKEN